METNIQTALAVVRDAGQLPVTWNSLDECTQEILAWKNTIGLGVIRVGQALLWAKERLPHGDFMTWLRDTVDFSPSSAQNFMRIAREVTEGESIARLPYTKILALLEVPREERESFAEAHDAAHTSAAELKRLARELAESRKEAEQLRLDTEGLQAALREKDDAAEQAGADNRNLTAKLTETQAALKEARQALALEREKGPATVERVPDDYLQVRSEAEALRRRLQESEAEADRLADELDRRKLQEAGAEPNDALCNRIVSGIGGLMAMVGQLPEQMRRNPEQMTEDDWSLTCNRVNALYQWCQLILGACPYEY